MKILCVVYQEHLACHAGITDAQADAYVEELEEALMAAFPDADIEVPLRRRVSGVGCLTEVDWESDGELVDEVNRISCEVYQRGVWFDAK